jgi:hypothetical protein
MGQQRGSAGKYILPLNRVDKIAISSQVKAVVVNGVEPNSDART